MKFSIRHAIYGNRDSSIKTNVNVHSHLCTKCNHIWSHPDSERGNKEAHKCPSCGELLTKGWPQLSQQKLEQLRKSGAIKL